MKNKQYILVGSALFNGSETQRMIEIADELKQRGYTIVFIGAGQYDTLLENKDYIREVIAYDRKWYNEERISKMLAMDRYGCDFASKDEIKKIIEAEIQVIKKYNPIVILTGYRMTLTISSRICKVPIVWSLSATVSKIQLEQVLESANQVKRNSKQSYQQLRSLYENKIACQRVLNQSQTVTLWNQVLESYGCETLKCDLDIYTGDLNLMSDAKELFPDLKENDQYKFIGPILNNQYIEMPQIVSEVLEQNNGRKKILISIGTSGKKELLMEILKTTREFDYDFFISVFDVLSKEEMDSYPKNYHFCEKFPLIDIAQLCDFAIIQAGQGTLYAMLAAKCPIVSIPTTFEQRQNIENLLKHYQCGEMIPFYDANQINIKKAITCLLNTKTYKEEILRANKDIQKHLIDGKRTPIQAANYIEDYILHKGSDRNGENTRH